MGKSNEKKTLVLSFIAVIILILVVVGATYAYFTSQSGGTDNIDINASSSTTDNLSFQAGSEINITASENDFGIDMGNKSGSTFVRATLSANNATNTATKHYYVYLDIKENDFVYTNGDTAELLLKVTSPTGEVTIILGLDRKTSGTGDNQVTGFDITTEVGLITIADNYEITASPNKTDEWTVEVVFVNLDSDQVENAGKSFDATLIIQEEAMTTSLGNAAEYIASLYTTDGENGLYLHDADLANGANDNSYRYAGANPNNYVCFGSNNDTCSNDNLYRIIGVFGDQVKLIKHDYATTSLLGTNGAYSQTYEEWGMDSTYKGSIDGSLIGVYYRNNSTNVNTWSQSNLNTVNLNTNYLNNIGSKWSSLIATTNWKVGGNSWANIGTATPKTAYQNEIVNPTASTTYSAKIGLMYVSDYGYAASPAAWTLNMNRYNNSTATSNNWMYMGLYEWTISRDSDGTGNAFCVDYTGLVNNISVSRNYYGVRPSFYLESSVVFSQGDGSEQNPYRIQV